MQKVNRKVNSMCPERMVLELGRAAAEALGWGAVELPGGWSLAVGLFPPGAASDAALCIERIVEESKMARQHLGALEDAAYDPLDH